MKNTIVYAMVIWFVFVCLPQYIYQVRADELEDITRQLTNAREELNSSVERSVTYTKKLQQLFQNLLHIETRVQEMIFTAEKKRETIEKGDSSLEQNKNILDLQIKNHYKTTNKPTIITFLLQENIHQALLESTYAQHAVTITQNILIDTAINVREQELVLQKIVLELQKLKTLLQELQEQKTTIEAKIKGEDVAQAQLKVRITELSIKQNSIILARSGQFSTSAGSVEYDDYAASKDFTPGFSPAFGFFSIGAYTHKKGMSQYGAKGRAESGKNFQDILYYYYPNTRLETRSDLPQEIDVEGYGKISLEDRYLLGIAEMPSSWHKDALKSQAVAARTYALRYVGWPSDSRTICTTENCQVFSDEKSQSPPDAWRIAVAETKGQILLDGDSPASTWYSSTTGGYIQTSGWDTTDGQHTNFLERAYERVARSPWFYKAWYRANYNNTSDNCGRGHPWLTEKETADIVNAWIVRKAGLPESSQILPITINTCSISEQVGSPIGMDELFNAAERTGRGINHISHISVLFSTTGNTDAVVFETNKGTIQIPGAEWKEIFNLRAPGYISIRNTLYGVEQK